MTNREGHGRLVEFFNQTFAHVKKNHEVDAKPLYGNARDDEDLRPMEGCVRTSDVPSDRLELEAVYVAMPDCFSDESIAGEPVDAYDFVGTMVSICHEHRHVEQHLMEREPGNALAKIFAVNWFAVQLNRGYYKENYFGLPVEIDAQHMGMRNVYRLLRNMDGIGEKTASDYICYYQRRHQKGTRHDYIPKHIFGGYRSVDEIFDAFASSFKDSIHAKRSYCPVISYSHGDDAMRLLRADSGKLYQFKTELDGFVQDEMLASLYFERMAKRHGDSGPFMRDAILGRLENSLGLDLSVTGIFDRASADMRYQGRLQPGSSDCLAEQAFREVMGQVRARDELTAAEKILDMEPYWF